MKTSPRTRAQACFQSARDWIRSGKGSSAQKSPFAYAAIFLLTASVSTAGGAQSPQPAVSAAAAPASAAPPPQVLPSLLDQPAKPATISFTNRQLSVTATNASLSQILRQVGSATGTKVDGISRDQRVFGVYGPGTPQEVLTALLYDSGYNSVMVGVTENGAPRQLLLSTRGTGGAAGAQSAPTQAAQSDDEDDDSGGQRNDGPVELVQPPPVAEPAGQQPAQPNQVKTPEEMLRELQQMHQQQGATGTPQ